MVHIALLFLAINLFWPTPEPPKFEAEVIDDKVSIGYGLAIGDVDGDRKPDILLADKKQFVWYRNGDWKKFVMVENLTESDNVCIAARDIDGDGKVEVAVGAQWNPSETSDTLRSGAVYYLVRPKDVTRNWTPVRLHHEPVTHRMRWAKAGNKHHLIVLPLHGKGNKGGEGKGVKVFAYEMPSNPEKESWKLMLMDESMHLTHNLDVISRNNMDVVYIGGKEGVKAFTWKSNRWTLSTPSPWVVEGKSFGEVRVASHGQMIAGIEPMHGNELTVYSSEGSTFRRTSLADDLNQGHALAITDMIGNGGEQIIVGWREPNKESKVGIKIFIRENENSRAWQDHWVDDNGMACEDLQVADLNDDGKPDIIAAGRATKNLKIYWNRN